MMRSPLARRLTQFSGGSSDAAGATRRNNSPIPGTPIPSDGGAITTTRLRPYLDRGRGSPADLGLEGAQPLIDRNQFNYGAPGVDEILKRVLT